MKEAFQLDQITVSGSFTEMGQQQGEAFRARIQAFMAVRFDAVEGYCSDRGFATTRLKEIAHQSMAIFQDWDRDGFDEHLGIAQGAQVDAVDLYLATNMTDMRDALILEAPAAADHEGCSSILVPASMTRDGVAIAGQTWDLNPPDIEYIVAVKRRPEYGPSTWTVTCAGCLTLMGINQTGLSVGTTNIKTRGSRPGVGYLSVLHRLIRTHSVREAASILKNAPRAGAHVYWLADPVELREYETSPDRIVRREAGKGPLCHTNHCLDTVHQTLEGEASSDSSRCRLDRLETLLDRDDHTLETIQAIFADRHDGVLSINRYAEDDQGTATNAVFVAFPAHREAHACRGPADRGAWTVLGF
ncbi:MAG: C45 family peptidase [Myxococcota bacterium]|nr:C45 family peptidase [Myxococcota bacterium]